MLHFLSELSHLTHTFVSVNKLNERYEMRIVSAITLNFNQRILANEHPIV